MPTKEKTDEEYAIAEKKNMKWFIKNP